MQSKCKQLPTEFGVDVTISGENIEAITHDESIWSVLIFIAGGFN